MNDITTTIGKRIPSVLVGHLARAVSLIAVVIVMTATPAASAPAPNAIETTVSSVTIGKNCTGDRAYRCAWFNYDDAGMLQNLRGYGSIRNTLDWPVYVEVTAVVLQGGRGPYWDTLTQTTTPKRGLNYVEYGIPMLTSCNRIYDRYRTVVFWKWEGQSPIATGYIQSLERDPCS